MFAIYNGKEFSVDEITYVETTFAQNNCFCLVHDTTMIAILWIQIGDNEWGVEDVGVHRYGYLS